MPSGFMKVRFHALEKDEDELQEAGTRSPARRGVGRPRERDDRSVHFNNDEAAARYYLSKVFERDERPGIRGLRSAEDAQLVPDVRMVGTQDLPLTRTRLVRFQQTKTSIPIFGSRLDVELDENRELVEAVGGVAEVRGVSPVAALSPAEALGKIAALASVDEVTLQGVLPPELTFFHDDKEERWHLAYFFKKVPAAPEGFLAAAADRKSHGHGLSLSPRQRNPRLNFLVDAQDGEVLFYYSAAPLVDIPSKCVGIDEFDSQSEFWGLQIEGGFQMNDPMRFIKTYDHELNDLEDDPLPTLPVRNEVSNWEGRNKAAVSAHVNATRVYNFFNSVLMRDGIDDKGMDLVSIVNCTYAESEDPPEWHNAVWYDNRMWYGQEHGDGEDLRSYSRFLDIIAHELTHGITEYTSNLVYQGESGALNESFSDIFGIIIDNWYAVGQDSDVEDWNWELGAGLGPNGQPLRDLSDPGRTGDPDHMDDYLETPFDSGGVHTNSNIHNKAAYNVLTAVDGNGQRLLTPREVAVLYYLCLVRLDSQSTFSEALQTLVDVATVYYAGNEEEREEKIRHIRDGYQRVGIT